MKSGIRTYLLLASVVVWGILVGGIVYSNLIVMPVFLGDLPASASVVNGQYAINEAPFWMVIHPAVVISTLIALAANWRNRFRRRSIAIALGIYVSILIVTAVYFVPELLLFARGAEAGLSATELAAKASTWRISSWIRGLVIAGLYVQLLFALVKGEDQT